MLSKWLSLRCDGQTGKMKYSEIEKKLKKAGCYWSRDSKKHPWWYSPITGLEFQLSHHKSQEAKKGTMKSISKDSGVNL